MAKDIRRKGSILIKIIKAIVIVIAAFALSFFAIIMWLTVTEYKPADSEVVDIVQIGETEPEDLVTTDEPITLMTWNTGYGALGDNADFFMDGGKRVYTADKDRVMSNLDSMLGTITDVSPDILLLQEVDIDSSRSYGINTADYLAKGFKSESDKECSSSLAYNFRVSFIPYPIPPIGRVYSGIQTVSHYKTSSSYRVSLPSPFKWPVRVANLKRCLLINRLPVKDSTGALTDRELVLINLHLEAYDSGEGKTAQTKALRSVLEDEISKGNYVIAGGDFNQTFSNVDISVYPHYEGCWQCGNIDTDEFPDSLSFIMDNKAPTCRSIDRPYAGADKDNFQFYMIDGYIVSDNVTVNKCETLDLGFAATDHNPVVINVTLK